MDLSAEKEIIIDLINNHCECEYLDFKQIPYKDEKKSELIKDVIAFANGNCNKNKYIIFGIENNSKRLVGIENTPMEDSSEYQKLMDKIEPQLNIECGTIEYEGKKIGFIKVLSDNTNRPYFIKSGYGKDKFEVKQGQSFIRKGSISLPITRADLDNIYSNGGFEISFYDNMLNVAQIHVNEKIFIVNEITRGYIDIQVKNFSQRPVIIDRGFFDLCDLNGNLLVENKVLNIDTIDGNDFQTTFQPNTEKIVKLFISFSSDHCITLNLDDDGTADDWFIVRLVLIDVNKNEYFAQLDKCMLNVKEGPVLHKIKLKYRKMKSYLKKNYRALKKAVEEKNYFIIENIMTSKCIDFKLVKESHIINSEEFPITAYIYELAKIAVANNDEKLLNYFRKIGLNEDVISKVQGKEIKSDLPKIELKKWDDVMKIENMKFVESRKFDLD